MLNIVWYLVFSVTGVFASLRFERNEADLRWGITALWCHMLALVGKPIVLPAYDWIEFHVPYGDLHTLTVWALSGIACLTYVMVASMLPGMVNTMRMQSRATGGARSQACQPGKVIRFPKSRV